MENNEREINEEVINEEAVEAEVVPEEETDLIEVSDEPEGSGVGGLILGGLITAGVGYATYKAIPKIKAAVKKRKAKHDAKKRQAIIEYAVKNGLANEIAEATAKSLAETAEDDYETIPDEDESEE